MPVELQKVVRAPLRDAGDASAVIEMPGGFATFLALDRTACGLSAAALTVPERNYQDWLNNCYPLPP